jgi:PilZ domain-containing protein
MGRSGQNSAVPPIFDRRRSPRRAVRHVGVILTEHSETRQYCMVTDESDGGVRIIYTAANLEPPSEFTLWFADTEGKYRVVWHKGLFIGAELVACVEHVEAPSSQSSATENFAGSG